MNELVTISKLSRLLKVSVRWLRKETDANRIPHLSAGRQTLYVPNAVRAVLIKRASQDFSYPLRFSILSDRRTA